MCAKSWQRLIRMAWLAGLVVLAGLAGCATNPVTGERELRLISEGEEISLGEEQYEPTMQAMGGPYNADPELVAYVAEVGERVAEHSDRPGLPYEFVVLNEGTPNAWALPGGKIAINRGLLLEMENEAELAAVIAHEIVHAAARHGAQRVERGVMLQAGVAAVGLATREHELSGLLVAGAGAGVGLISQRYSREAELEADRYGVRYMADAGYDPEAAVTLQEKFVRLAGNGRSNWLEGLFASHPPSEERVRANRKLAQELRAEMDTSDWTLGAERYARSTSPLREQEEAYARHDQGREALQADEPQRALELAEAAVSAYPEEAAFHALRGQALARLGQQEAALEALDAAVARNDRTFSFFLDRGLLRKELGREQRARSDLQRANELLPTAPAHLVLGELAEGEDERDRAIRHYERAAESDSAYGERAREALARLRGGAAG